jgi:hypothetical protein
MIEVRRLASRAQLPSGVEPYQIWDHPNGGAWAEFFHTSSGVMVRFPGLADFEVSADGRSVSCAPAPSASEATVEHLYLNQVVPLALGKSGKLAFHASAVQIDESAVAFVATSGRGKSTIAAAFGTGGEGFLTDDGLVLERIKEGYEVQPSHPSLGLWQDSQEHLLGENAPGALTQSYPAKARLFAGERLLHCSEPRRLLAAYFLGNGSAPVVVARPLTWAESLIEWIKNSFLLDIDYGPSIAAHFDGVAALAKSVRCYALDYPRRYDLLDEVLDSIRAQARGLELAT